MPRFLSKVVGVVLVGVFIAVPVGYAFHHLDSVRNFRTVREGVLYRSGQMSLAGLKRVIGEYGIRTVITLRYAHTPGEPPPDRDEEEYCKRMDLDYHRIRPRHWEARGGDGPPPVDPAVRTFVRIMADPRNHPVLVHCFGGIHRAGAYSAIYRMEFEGWSNAAAIAELKATGYTNLDDHWDILGYMERYQPSGGEEAQVPVGNARRKRRK